MSNLPHKVLLAVTGYYGPFYEDGAKTGLFYSEALHPYEYFTKLGFEVVLASESGRVGIDEHSTSSQFLNDADMAIYENPNSELNKLLKNVKRASDLKAKDFGIFFAAGGHGTDFDFPNAKHLHQLAGDIYAQGGVVAAVCHGPLILPGIVDKSNGAPLINGRKVSGFLTVGEEQLNLTHLLKSKGLPEVTDELRKAGGIVTNPTDPWVSFAVADGRVVSGPNPASALAVAEKSYEVFTSRT